MPHPTLNSRSKWLARSMAILVLALPVAANAATCNVSATTVGFGGYDTLSPLNDDATGTVTVSCSGGLISLLVSYNILLSKGGAGTYTPRRMASGSNTLNYNLYTNITRTTIWGDGTGGSSIVSDGYLVGLFVVTRNYTVYGRIPALQNVASGSYVDTITATVNY